jgi:signal peptidase II
VAIVLKKSALWVFWPSLLVLVIDRLTKLWVRSSMSLGESFPVLGRDFFRFTRVENSGIAFGLQPGSAKFLIIFNSLASLAIIFVLIRSRRTLATQFPRLVELSLTLILGGALGNLIDRIRFGYVTDFFDFDFPDFIMERWPVFNIADSAVTIGVTLWCIYLVFFAKTKSTSEPLTHADCSDLTD